MTFSSFLIRVDSMAASSLYVDCRWDLCWAADFYWRLLSLDMLRPIRTANLNNRTTERWKTASSSVIQHRLRTMCLRSYSGLGTGRRNKCLDVEPLSNVTLTAFSIWCGDFGTRFLFAPPLSSASSIIPYVCLHSDICPVWIRFLNAPIAWHCTPDAACDRCPAYDIVCLMRALDLRMIIQFENVRVFRLKMAFEFETIENMTSQFKNSALFRAHKLCSSWSLNSKIISQSSPG